MEFFEEVITGKAPWKKRLIKSVVDNLGKGDHLIVPELSRLGRSMLEIMEILSVCTEKGIEVYSVRDRWELNSSLQSKVIASVFAMAAEIERDLISARTKEALRARKAKGLHVGGIPGPRGSRFDKYSVEIRALRKNGKTYSSIGKLYGTCEAAIWYYLNRRKNDTIDEEAICKKAEEFKALEQAGSKQLWSVIAPNGRIPLLPETLLDKMRNAAVNCRIDILLEGTHEAEAYDKAFSQKMQKHIQKFDYDKIFYLLGIDYE